jgi:hypothetical protein
MDRQSGWQPDPTGRHQERGTSTTTASRPIRFATTGSSPLMRTVLHRLRQIRTVPGSSRGESHPHRQHSALQRSRLPTNISVRLKES